MNFETSSHRNRIWMDVNRAVWEMVESPFWWDVQNRLYIYKGSDMDYLKDMMMNKFYEYEF